MSRPQNRLNDQKAEVIAQNHLVQNPEGLETIVDQVAQVVIANHIPKMRKVVFLNGRDPGYPLDFHYSSKTHHLKHYTLYHGKEHDLPEEIIDHLENCAEHQYAYRVNPSSGHPEMYTKSLKYIFQCKAVKQNVA